MKLSVGAYRIIWDSMRACIMAVLCLHLSKTTAAHVSRSGLGHWQFFGSQLQVRPSHIETKLFFHQSNNDSNAFCLVSELPVDLLMTHGSQCTTSHVPTPKDSQDR